MVRRRTTTQKQLETSISVWNWIDGQALGYKAELLKFDSGFSFEVINRETDETVCIENQKTLREIVSYWKSFESTFRYFVGKPQYDKIMDRCKKLDSGLL